MLTRFARIMTVGALALLGGPTVQRAESAELVGTVRRANGEAIAGIYVTVREISQGHATTVFSNVEGRYTLEDLTPGFYDVCAGGRSLVVIFVDAFPVGDSGATLDIPYVEEMGPPLPGGEPSDPTEERSPPAQLFIV